MIGTICAFLVRPRSMESEPNRAAIIGLPFAEGWPSIVTGGVKLWKLVHLHYTLCVLHRGRAGLEVPTAPFFGRGPAQFTSANRARCTKPRACIARVILRYYSSIRAEFGTWRKSSESAASHTSLARGLLNPESLALFSRFRARLTDQEPALLEQELTALTSQLLLSANPNARPHRISETAVVRARQLIEDQFLADPTQRVCVRTLARELRVSYHYLVHGFTKRYAIAHMSS